MNTKTDPNSGGAYPKLVKCRIGLLIPNLGPMVRGRDHNPRMRVDLARRPKPVPLWPCCSHTGRVLAKAAQLRTSPALCAIEEIAPQGHFRTASRSSVHLFVKYRLVAHAHGVLGSVCAQCVSSPSFKFQLRRMLANGCKKPPGLPPARRWLSVNMGTPSIYIKRSVA